MRLSPQRHTLAVLRTRLELTQKEMALLAACARPTIQAIELGKLKLSYGMAQRIAFQVDVRLDWLLGNKVDVAPVATSGEPYTYSHFERRQAALFAPRTDTAAWADMMDMWCLFSRHIKLLSLVYTEAYRQDNVAIISYRVMTSVIEMLDSLRPDPAIKKKAALILQGKNHVECLNEVPDTISAFAHTTYDELKRKLKRSKVPLSPQLRKILGGFDKGLGCSRSAE